MSDGGQQLGGATDVAARFVAARLDGANLRAYPGTLPVTLAAAYSIQDAAIDLWPDEVAGWKSGLVQPQHRAAFGDAERIAGPIFRDQVRRAAGDSVIDLPLFAGGFAAVEAEFVFRIGRDAPAGRTDWSLEDAADLVGDLFIGIESAGSPFPGINDLGPAVTASDFGNNAGLVLGARIDNWRTIAATSLTVETFIDGTSVGRGDASMIPGGTLAALSFIAGNAASRGRPLRAGQFISTGAVTGVHAIAIGQSASADFGAYGQIRCRAVKAGPAPRDKRSERAKQLSRQNKATFGRTSMTTETAAPVGAEAARAVPVEVGRYRWVVVGLLFSAMVINYVDRQMIGVLKPGYLQPEFGWSERDFANIVFWFQAAYAGSYLLFGRIIDRIGAKWGFAAAFTIWTIAHIAHAGARNMTQFIMVRMLLGVGEGGAFPGGIKAVTEWFPKKERAFATGLFNAGTNIGAIVTPLVVPFIVVDLAMGWRASFVIIGVATLLWLPAWLMLYTLPQKNKNVGAAELAFIESDPADPVQKVSWVRVLRTRETWAYALGKFLIDPIWWFFLFWLPDFLGKTYGMNIKQFGPPLVAIYLLSDVGSIGGGWLSSTMMKRGMSLNAARKTAMLICALCALPIVFAAQASNVWIAVLIIGLATAAHQGFSANLYTLPGDVFPRSAVGTVIGVGGMLGGVGGMVFSKYVGEVLERIGTYTPIFLVAGSVYLIALLVVHLLTPKYAPADVG